MNTKIFLHCFVIMTAVALTTFLGEFLIRPQLDLPVAKAHAFFPVSSFPTILKEISGEKEKGDKDRVPAPPVKVTLKNGKILEGPMIKNEDGWITLEIDGDEVGFHQSEVRSMTKLSE